MSSCGRGTKRLYLHFGMRPGEVEPNTDWPVRTLGSSTMVVLAAGLDVMDGARTESSESGSGRLPIVGLQCDAARTHTRTHARSSCMSAGGTRALAQPSHVVRFLSPNYHASSPRARRNLELSGGLRWRLAMDGLWALECY